MFLAGLPAHGQSTGADPWENAVNVLKTSFKAFLGFSFYQVIASAFIFVFAKVLTSMFGVIGAISISKAFTILPALLITLSVCIFGLIKIPELTASILGGRTGAWVNPIGN